MQVRNVFRNIICEITENDIGVKKTEQIDENKYKLRKAARGILIKDGKLALLNVTTKKYHKLPGGGIEQGELIHNSFKREVKEETGWNCQIMDEEPVTLEYRSRIKVFQISYIFAARATGTPSEQKLDEGEIKDGHDLEWVSIDTVEELLSKENPDGYEDKFIHLRDLIIVKHYKDWLNDFTN